MTDTYYPRINGVSASTKTFAEEFIKLGHEVHIYAPYYPNDTDDSGPLNIQRFPSWYLFFDPEDRLARPESDPKLIQQFKDQKFDIVHTQTPFTLGGPAVKWARESGAKVVHTYHTLFQAYVEHYLWFIPKILSIWYVKNLSRRYCNSCDLLITPSSEMREVLLGYDVTQPIEVIPTGIHLNKFEDKDTKRFRNLKGYLPDEKLLLFMGRVAEEKNIEFLIRVVAKLSKRIPRLRFLIAGEGPAKRNLVKLVDKLGMQYIIHFAGYLTKEDWRDCYAGADLVLLASVTETQGLVISEAMASGVPVVAVGEMGVKDVMASGKGGIMTRLDEEEYGEAVYRLLTDEKLYAQTKSETIPEAEMWSSTAMAKKMIAAYEKILQK